MRKLFSLLAVLLLAAGPANAVVAPRTPYRYTQPDGSVITLVTHGDEYYNWTTKDGVMVEKGPDGFYRPAFSTGHAAKAAAADMARAADNQRRLGDLKSGLQFGTNHFPVILVAFDDDDFIVPDPWNFFNRMLNEQGFSDYGAIGSARDYFVDNSSGQFQPVYDIYGPVKLSKGYAYYGKGNDMEHSDEFIHEACSLADAGLDFSRYDLDGDGYVENVFLIYAGRNAAQSDDVDRIWPKEGVVTGNKIYDGVKLSLYACTSELNGKNGADVPGIGIFIHEFSHLLGLPDFYGPERDILNPEDFSPMSNGNYLNNCVTPSSLNSVERQMLGWMGDFPTVSDGGVYELKPVADNNLPWVIPSDVDGERFILEMRGGRGWDSALPKGMVIYHMDASENAVSRWYNAIDLWSNSMMVNQFKSHPCFYVVPSLKFPDAEDMIFPGSADVHEVVLKAWSGAVLPTAVRDISVGEDKVSFTLSSALQRIIRGTVSDPDGDPIGGAAIQVGIPEDSSPSGLQVRRTAQSPDNVRYSAVSEDDGSFEIFLDYEDKSPVLRVSVSKDGYIEQADDVAFSYGIVLSFTLRPVGTPSRAGLKRYDPDKIDKLSKFGIEPNPDAPGIMAAIMFTGEELFPYAGMEIRTITFCADVNDYNQIHAAVWDKRGNLISAVKAGEMGEDGWFRVDFSDEKLKIESGKDLYFGYAIDGNDALPVVYQSFKDVNNGMFHATYNLDHAYWFTDYNSALMLSVTLYEPAASEFVTLAGLGFTFIENPRWKEGYSEGDTFTFSLKEASGAEVTDTDWQFDGKAVTAPSITLTAGNHTVTARVRYKDGTEEVLSLELTVRP